MEFEWLLNKHGTKRAKRSWYDCRTHVKVVSNDVIWSDFLSYQENITRISVVAHPLAERQKWAKFGQEKRSKPGIEQQPPLESRSQSTHLPLLSFLKKSYLYICRKVQVQEVEQSSEDGAKNGIKVPAVLLENQCVGLGILKILRCYVPLISEDTQENDLREIFGGFGKVARVYVGRDHRETVTEKGFAFVSFDGNAVRWRRLTTWMGRVTIIWFFWMSNGVVSLFVYTTPCFSWRFF